MKLFAVKELASNKFVIEKFINGEWVELVGAYPDKKSAQSECDELNSEAGEQSEPQNNKVIQKGYE